MTWLAQHRKAVVAVVGAVVVILTNVLGSGNEIVQAVVSLATAVGVYGTPNDAPA